MPDRPHVCFDRILPLELMRPQRTRRAARGRVRGISPIGKTWMNGSTLHARFIGGNATQRATAREQAGWWTDVANLQLVFDDAPNADIRVAFDAGDGAWSYIGTDARQIPLDQPTMNLGFLDGGTAAHEWGHAIGLAHEHQNPDGGIEWNEDIVIRAMAGPPNYWDAATTRHNILRRYSADQINGDTPEEQYLTQLVGFEEAFDNWAAWCRGDASCPFTAGDVGARWDALRQQLDDNPVPGSDGRLGNQAVMDTATTAALYSESEWPVLADALARAEAGDSDPLFALADGYEGRNPDGTFNTLFQSFPIIQCASGIEDQPVPDPQALLDELREKAPRFSKDITLEDLQYDGGSCDDLMDDQPVVELNYSGTAPILVVGGQNDPATPYRWAEEMVGELGPSATLLTYTGEGHGQMLVSTCVTDAEAATLADMTLPDDGAVCDPDPVVERPSWWGDLPTPPGVGDPVSLPALTAAIGLTDTTGYGETRLTSMSPQQAADAYIAAFGADGYRSLGSEPVTDLGDTVRAAFLTPDGSFVLVFVMGPEALALDDLSGAASSVPEGQSVVLVAYLPD